MGDFAMNSCAQQRTLAEPSPVFHGVGLHGGKVISIRLLPAPVDSGINFVRTDCGNKSIAVCVSNVKDTLLATTLGDGEIEVGTIEHLLSALCACGVDNVDVELDGPEVPIMDGSAQPFVTILQDCGLAEQDAPKQFFRIMREVSVKSEGGKEARFSPYQSPVWDITIDYEQPVIRKTAQRRVFALSSNTAYVAEIARARTFGFIEDLDMMRDHQRAKGGSLENAVVLERTKVLNQEGLRQPDEFACHKLLDAIGDCYIGGHLAIGRYVAKRPGHALNHKLMSKLLSQPDSYEKVTASQLAQLPDFGPLQAASI